MPTLLKFHHYVNRNPKTNRYVHSIIPQADREVPQRLFDCFDDVTTTPEIRLDDSYDRNVLSDILQTTGAEQ